MQSCAILLYINLYRFSTQCLLAGGATVMKCSICFGCFFSCLIAQVILLMSCHQVRASQDAWPYGVWCKRRQTWLMFLY